MRKIITAFLLATLVSTASAAPQVVQVTGGVIPVTSHVMQWLSSGIPTTSLVSWWKFDEGTGTSSADSQSANTATLTASTMWTNQAEEGSYSLSTVGASQSASAAYNTNMIMTTAVTVCAWLYVKGLPAYGSPVQFAAHTSGWTSPYFDYGFQFGAVSTTNLSFLIGISGGNGTQYAGAQITTGVWFHVCGTYDSNAGYIKMYTNGAFASQFALTNQIWNPGAMKMYFGKENSSGTYPYNGFIDEVLLYSRALSATEVGAVYNAK